MLKEINQVYIPYYKWEDYKNGMWNRNVDNENDLLKKAIYFTGDHKKYGESMNIVVKLWVNTMANSLTNPSINHKAFVGHCAVSYQLSIPEYITRKAWKYLNQKQRDLADWEAEKAIRKWRVLYLNTLKLGKKDVIKNYQMKLQLK
jgi:hypothetical protein